MDHTEIARLEASNKELLAALVGLLAECRAAGFGDINEYEWPHWIRAATTAIAKAEGK